MNLGERVVTTIAEGPFAGTTATVDRIIGWPVFAVGSHLRDTFAASEGAAVMGALEELYDYYEAEARPVWNVEDGRGPVPPTSTGMLRVPVPLVADLYGLWMATFAQVESEPEGETAVDQTVPPGPVRDELNARLRKARKD